MELKQRLGVLRRQSGAGPLASGGGATVGERAATAGVAAGSGEVALEPAAASAELAAQPPAPAPVGVGPEPRAPAAESFVTAPGGRASAGSTVPPDPSMANPVPPIPGHTHPLGGGSLPGRIPPVGDRLTRLRPGGRGREQAEERLRERLGATVLAPGCLLIEERLPLERRHGAEPLASLYRPLTAVPGLAGRDPRGFLFLDTETTGLSGGSGTAVFLLGLARLEGETLVTRQYLLTAFSGERALLGEAEEWLGWAQGLVTFNGRSFDVPLLATRCRLAGVRDRFSPLEQLDLLHPTRRAFLRRWPDCRLATVERRLLGLTRSDDLPGSEAPAAWLGFLNGDGSRLPGVVRHNRLDLLSLAVLIPRLDQVYAAPGEHGADLLAVARAHRERGEAGRCERLLQNCDEARGQLELARLYRRRREWQAALALWLPLARQGEIEAIEALAKYYEHVARDPLTALSWAERLPAGEVRRRARLTEKCRGGELFAAGGGSPLAM